MDADAGAAAVPAGHAHTIMLAAAYTPTTLAAAALPAVWAPPGIPPGFAQNAALPPSVMPVDLKLVSGVLHRAARALEELESCTVDFHDNFVSCRHPSNLKQTITLGYISVPHSFNSKFARIWGRLET